MKELAGSAISTVSCHKELAKIGCCWRRVPLSLLLHELPQVHVHVSLLRIATAYMEKLAGGFLPAVSLFKKLAPLKNISHVTHGSV